MLPHVRQQLTASRPAVAVAVLRAVRRRYEQAFANFVKEQEAVRTMTMWAGEGLGGLGGKAAGGAPRTVRWGRRKM